MPIRSALSGLLRSKSDSFRDYYKSCPLASGITDLQHRQIRFDMGKKFLTMKRPIRDDSCLRRALSNHAPKNAYYSVGRWLEPHNLVPKYKATKVHENLFLGCDLAFDIDFKPFSVANIEKARLEALKLTGFLGSKAIRVKYVAFSGSKGFHVLCDDPNSYPYPNPYEREEQAKKYRVALCSEIEEEGIEIDSAITTDTRRIIRIPGTINHSTGYLCRVLGDGELQAPAVQILKNTPRVSYSSLLTFWDDCVLRTYRISPRSRAMKGKPGSIYFSTLASSAVLGVKGRVVPVFTYQDESTANLVSLLSKVQNTYSLGDIFIFQDGREHFAMSLDSLPLTRALKASKAAKSLSTSKLAMYKQNWLRIDAKIAEDGKSRLSGKPGLVMVLRSKGPVHPSSAGHALLLRKEFGIEASFKNRHGKDEYKVVHTIMKD